MLSLAGVIGLLVAVSGARADPDQCDPGKSNSKPGAPSDDASLAFIIAPLLFRVAFIDCAFKFALQRGPFVAHG